MKPVIRDNISVTDYYDFKKILGQGAYAGVVLATNKASGQFVAIKVVDRKKMSFKESERIRREIDINFKISHPNIVCVFEVIRSTEEICLIMELMQGGDLFDYIAENGSLSELKAKRCIKDVLDAVNYLHSLKIAHRDLKPENLVFQSKEPDAPLKLIDFGFSKMINGSQKLETPLGTVAYTAPDITKQESYTHAVDIWSVGCILYFMLFSKPPFYSEQEQEIKKLVTKAIYHIPESPVVSDEVKDLLSHLLEKKPELRYKASEALNHPWFKETSNDPTQNTTNPLSLSNEHKSKLRRSVNILVDTQREDDELLEEPFLLGPISSSTIFQKRAEKKKEPRSVNQHIPEEHNC